MKSGKDWKLTPLPSPFLKIYLIEYSVFCVISVIFGKLKGVETMVLEHDIPAGGRLYVGEKARLKREIEGISAKILEGEGFREIVTPYFSYHQGDFIRWNRLIRFADRENRIVTLRGDTSFDLLRLVVNRLKTPFKKWFYIQPVFRYPTREIYQIGAEWLEGDLKEIFRLNRKILETIGVKGTPLFSHWKVIEWLLEEEVVTPKELREMNLGKFQWEWLRKLASLSQIGEWRGISGLPSQLKPYLEELDTFMVESGVTDGIIALLELPPFQYYTGVFYKIIGEQALFARGGSYRVGEVEGVGFSIYTDQILEGKERENFQFSER